MTEDPRWTLELTPGGFSVTVHGADVTQGEIAFHLAQALVRMAAAPNQRMPTVAEVQAEHARRQLLADHPGTHLYTRAGSGVFLGESARAQGAGERLEAAGWSEVLVLTPEKATEPCAYQSLGEEAFAGAYLGSVGSTADA
jgi:hypothetical protein